MGKAFVLGAARHSARVSKMTNDGLTRSGTGCFIAVTIMATVGVKGLTYIYIVDAVGSKAAKTVLVVTYVTTVSNRNLQLAYLLTRTAAALSKPY